VQVHAAKAFNTICGGGGAAAPAAASTARNFAFGDVDDDDDHDDNAGDDDGDDANDDDDGNANDNDDDDDDDDDDDNDDDNDDGNDDDDASTARNVALGRNRIESSTQARIRLQGSNASRMRTKDGDHLYGAWQVQARVTGAPGAVTAFYLRCVGC
jgi:hypothetical protein